MKRFLCALVVFVMFAVMIPAAAFAAAPATSPTQAQLEDLQAQVLKLDQQLRDHRHGPTADPVGVRLWRTGTAIDADWGVGLDPVSGASAYAGALIHNGHVYANAWTACEVISLLGGGCSMGYPTSRPNDVTLYGTFPGGAELMMFKLGEPSSPLATIVSVIPAASPEPLVGSFKPINVWFGMISVRSLAAVLPNVLVRWQSGGEDGVGEVIFIRKG